MAYSGSFTTQTVGRDGEVLIIITETGGTTTGELEITGLPKTGRIFRQVGGKTSGAAATVDPVLGTLTNPAALPETTTVSNDTAAATVDNLQAGGVPYYTATGSLFHRSVYDSGTNNAGTFHYFLKPGWDE